MNNELKVFDLKPSLNWQSLLLKIELIFDPTKGLYIRTLQIKNFKKIDAFCSKLVFYIGGPFHSIGLTPSYNVYIAIHNVIIEQPSGFLHVYTMITRKLLP